MEGSKTMKGNLTNETIASYEDRLESLGQPTERRRKAVMSIFRSKNSNYTKPNERALLLVGFALIGFALSPMAHAQDPIAQVLVGHQWVVRSSTLGNGIALAVIFNQDGSFRGMITAPPGDYMVPNQRTNGAWYSAQPLLILQWDWVRGPGQFKMREHNEVPIEITTISSNRMQGMDKWVRLWQFARVN